MFYLLNKPRNQFQGINFARLCSLAGRYENPIPTRYLAPIECIKFHLSGTRAIGGFIVFDSLNFIFHRVTSSTKAVSEFIVFDSLNFIFQRVTSSKKAVVVFLSFVYVDFIFHPRAT
jgi:hypothetical protein